MAAARRNGRTLGRDLPARHPLPARPVPAGRAAVRLGLRAQAERRSRSASWPVRSRPPPAKAVRAAAGDQERVRRAPFRPRPARAQPHNQAAGHRGGRRSRRRWPGSSLQDGYCRGADCRACAEQPAPPRRPARTTRAPAVARPAARRPVDPAGRAPVSASGAVAAQATQNSRYRLIRLIQTRMPSTGPKAGAGRRLGHLGDVIGPDDLEDLEPDRGQQAGLERGPAADAARPATGSSPSRRSAGRRESPAPAPESRSACPCPAGSRRGSSFSTW